LSERARSDAAWVCDKSERSFSGQSRTGLAPVMSQLKPRPTKICRITRRKAARLVPKRRHEAAAGNSKGASNGGATGATVPVECSPGRVLASSFPQGHARNRPGGRRRDARHFAHLEFAVLLFRVRNVYPETQGGWFLCECPRQIARCGRVADGDRTSTAPT
jgi:hypothetical protein